MRVIFSSLHQQVCINVKTLKYFSAAAKSLQSCPTLCDPIDVWQPTRLPHPWDSPGKSTGVGCHINSWILEEAYPFSRGSDPGIKQGSSVLQVDSLPAELPGKPPDRVSYLPIFFFKIEFFKIVSALCSPIQILKSACYVSWKTFWQFWLKFY